MSEAMTATARTADPSDVFQPIVARPHPARPPRPQIGPSASSFWGSSSAGTETDDESDRDPDELEASDTETSDDDAADLDDDDGADDDGSDDGSDTRSDDRSTTSTGRTSDTAGRHRKRRGRPPKARGQSHSSDAAAARWTVRGVPTNVRDMALRAADARNMTVGDWLAEAIIARARAQPKPEEPKVPATAAAAPPDLVSLIERMDQRLARLEAQSGRGFFERLFGRRQAHTAA